MVMRYFYAELNGSNIVKCILDADREIVSASMIPLTDVDGANVGDYWNGAAFSTVETTVEPELRRITVLAFLNRFTKSERIATDLASIDNPSAALSARQQAASVRDDLTRIRSAKYIDLDLEETRSGVELLEAAGLIGVGRAAVILDAPISLNESYAPNV
jgi:hypothetical protein